MAKLENRIVIITRATRLEKVLAAQNTVSQAKFYIKQLGGDFEEYNEEHQRYGNSLGQVRQDLDALGPIQVLDRNYLPNFIFAPDDIVVVLGQDGLVANTLKYLDNQPVIGVNPDPERWDGVLLPFLAKDAALIVEETATGKRRTEGVSMAKVRVQNGQELYAVNDFFIGQRTHTSARYVIKFNGFKEPQSSSGIIVATGMGSTGWMKSIIAGAKRVSSSVIGSPYGSSVENESLCETDEEIAFESDQKLEDAAYQAVLSQDVMEFEESAQEPAAPFRRQVEKSSPELLKLVLPAKRKKKEYGLSELSSVMGKWGSRELVFAVREPFPSKTTGTTLVFGKISQEESLRVESLMGENGVIFSDGIESDFIAFNSGTEAVISLADKKGHLVV